ncbi:MAG TPA: hypothetical protein VMT62_17120 [Syntrophorhabdaceae bacterium]|nr:hypothetical protein [Syntrophorhabdaceae bacterium]
MIRISDSMRYAGLEQSIARISKQLNDLEIKVSSQKNVNTPSDDPTKFATNVQLDAERSLVGQFTTNLQSQTLVVNMYGTCFSSIGDQLSNLEQLANNYESSDASVRQSASEEVKGIIEQLVTVGNTKLGGAYIFGGKQSDVAPFQLNNDYSVSFNTPESAEDVTQIYVDKSEKTQYGISGRSAFYGSSKIAYGSVGNAYTGDVYSDTDKFAYVIDGTNNALVVNGVTLTLASGVYTGSGLAQQIQTQLGANYSVGFDTTTRKFAITNNTGSDATFNWSTANSASTLGFNNVNAVVASSQTAVSDLDTGRKSFLIKITNDGPTTGSVAARATYEYSIDGGSTWSADIAVSTGGADTTAGDITIDNTNHTFYRNGVAVTLANGTYTGAGLATQIASQLGAGYSVNYDSTTRKFSITNNTGSVVTLNWSNPLSTAAGVLGFDTADSVVGNGSSDTSDYDAGMFVDGSGVANATNNRIKFAFSTASTDTLTTADTFQVKDLNIFELLKNFKDAFSAGDTTWISKNIQNVESARALTTKNAAVIAFQGTQATTMTTNNKTKDANIETMQTSLTGADENELAVQLNVLMNTYQALLATMSKVLSVNILNYLK